MRQSAVRRSAVVGRPALWAGLALAIVAATALPASAQQYFNGSQTAPNGAINGGGGVWNGTTTNWTNDTGTVSSAYDPLSVGTVFGSSGLSTPATGGTVAVAPGGVQLTGVVVFDVTGDNSTYTIQGGDLTLAPGGGTVFFVNDVTGTPAPSAVIASRIVGNEAFTVQGPGILALTGASTYTGGTFICGCASLQLGDSTHTASIIGDVTNEGYFNIVNANTAGITSIKNDGAFGPATTTFFNATTASSIAITNVHDGQTYFGTFRGNDTATAGNATILNTFGGTTVFFARTNAGTASITNGRFGETVFIDQSSAGSATIVNAVGTTTFGQAFGTDTPTAGNATIINQSRGLTQFGAFSTAGNATIITNFRGETDFYDNSTGGNARFITSGVVDFGGSVGPNGDGRITAGSIEGTGVYYIGGGNTLVVGSNNLSTEVSGMISDFNPCGCGPAGPGSLEKVGSGTLILSGQRNNYTGTTTVNGGILQVDGSIVSSVLTTVNAGGALTGTGVVGDTLIASGGIYAPGTGLPGSSMQVFGSLAFQSGALYLVTLNSTDSSFATVTGNAALDGTVLASFISGSTVQPKYKIMDVGSHSGNFAGVAAPGGLVGTISFDPTSVYLDFTLDWSSKFNLSVNQQNVANTLVNFFNANGGIPAVFASLAPTGLTQVSGEPATGSQQTTFNAMNLFLGLLTDPSAAGRGAGFGGGAGATPFAEEASPADAYAAAGRPRGKRERDVYAAVTRAVPRNELLDPRWSVWAAGFGGSQTTDGSLTLGSATVTSRVIGTAVGVDYLLSPRTIAGFALAGGGTSFSLANGLGSGRSDLFQAGAFVRHQAGAAYVIGALAYGWQDVTTDRTVTAAGVDRLRAQFNANTFAGRLEGGYRYATPWMGITPYVAAQFTTFNLPNYAEGVVSGANTFALTYAARSVTDTRSELGVRTDKSFARPDGIVTLRGRLAWAHDFNPDRNVGAVFQTLPGAAFVVNGAAQAHDSALTTASAEMKWLNGWSAIAAFEGEFSSVTRSYAGKGVARYAW